MNFKGCEKQSASSKPGINSKFYLEGLRQTGMNFNQVSLYKARDLNSETPE